MAADNNLSDMATLNVQQMIAARSSPDVRIVVQVEQNPQETPGAERSTLRGTIENGASQLQDLGRNVDMSSRAALTAFIRWGKQNYPAERYALVLWSHGGGWKADKSTRGALQDVSSREDLMSVRDMAAAVKDAGGVDLLNFDACLMACGSKRLSMFNELIAGVRQAVPDRVIQVGGSISFAPESEGAAAKWLSDDTRHMLAELTPKPDQVKVTVNTSQVNVIEQMDERDIAGTSLAEPDGLRAYSNMVAPSTPRFFEEHVRRLSAAGIQSAFQFYNINSYETVERLVRRGVYKGPLVMNWVAIGGGMDAPNIYNLANFPRAIPDGSMLTVESSMLNTLPINMMGIAMGLHVRCGIDGASGLPVRAMGAEHNEKSRRLTAAGRSRGRNAQGLRSRTPPSARSPRPPPPTTRCPRAPRHPAR